MTTPQERMRSIGWGAELLDAMQLDSTVPEPFKVEGRRIAQTYPSTTALLELLATSSREFPATAGRSIEDARVLFERLRATGAGTEEIRRHVMFTLRHFPLAGWAKHANDSARLGHLDDWLAPDGP